LPCGLPDVAAAAYRETRQCCREGTIAVHSHSAYPHRGYPRLAGSELSHRPQRHRAVYLGYLVLAALGVVAIRLFELQVIHHKYYIEEIAPIITPGDRLGIPVPGSILARDSGVLAKSITSYSLVANTVTMRREGESFAGAAQQVASILGKDADTIRSKLETRERTAEGSQHVVLKQWLSSDQVSAIQEANISGIVCESAYRRHYPNGVLASSLLGARNQFHIPLGGLEYCYRLLIDGRCSATAAVSDSLGGNDIGHGEAFLPGVSGLDLMLTLDLGLQRYVEACMDALCRREHPKGASAVVLKPSTGEILAMCTRPAFDPDVLVSGIDADKAARSAFRERHMHNLAVEQDFAPGSTFKVLLAAAALENRLDPDRRFHCPGHCDVGGRPINCWGEYRTRGHGDVNMERMIAMSCNVTAARIALELGPQRYIDFLRRAGIGTVPHAGFPAETAGILPRPQTLARRDLAAMGFGQSVSTSPLQLVAAVSAIANGGVKTHPHIIAAVLNKDGTVFRRPSLPKPVRVCNEAAARQVLDMMTAAVRYGTARVAAIDGVDVAAKTGTSQIWDPRTRSFYADRYIMSFLLICPADKPEFVVYVAADEPQVGRHGADVAGPTARDIADFALRQVAGR